MWEKRPTNQLIPNLNIIYLKIASFENRRSFKIQSFVILYLLLMSWILWPFPIAIRAIDFSWNLFLSKKSRSWLEVTWPDMTGLSANYLTIQRFYRTFLGFSLNLKQFSVASEGRKNVWCGQLKTRTLIKDG